MHTTRWCARDAPDCEMLCCRGNWFFPLSIFLIYWLSPRGVERGPGPAHAPMPMPMPIYAYTYVRTTTYSYVAREKLDWISPPCLRTNVCRLLFCPPHHGVGRLAVRELLISSEDALCISWPSVRPSNPFLWFSFRWFGRPAWVLLPFFPHCEIMWLPNLKREKKRIRRNDCI